MFRPKKNSDQEDKPPKKERGRRRRFVFWAAITILVLFGAAVLINAGYYVGSISSGAFCATCHIIRPSVELWQVSTHRNIPCSDCHGSAFTLSVEAQRTHWERLYLQLTGRLPRDVALKDRHVDALNERCIACHQQAGAAWIAGGHSMRYRDVFLNTQQNRSVQLNDDCFRCHGLYYDRGAVTTLVEPIDTTGPWRFRDPAVADRPAIPCLSCHRMHTPGSPAARPNYAEPRRIGQTREAPVHSLAFYDRRERLSVPTRQLPQPRLTDTGRSVTMSPDRRQALCYQCHAPDTSYHVGSGDDRTPVGVHEGISCLACHANHTQDARASCATCHPKMSNCGLDVEKMDTTFRSSDSPNNIHWVRCEDCHRQGVPERRAPGS
ncbi:MAG TPA: multiheme c-type cytochrome [Acidobacteriota bacterium]|jgi:hypothetical protein|nr:multiheme c-type cytochrome [Acidobacteriota bacterium]HRR57213.1 multiheme c-type cytochrome [Acidobacteriota bacterium]